VHRYHPAQRVKYGILVGALFAAALGLQWIGLLDPIALTIRSFALSLGPLGEWAVRGFFDGLYRLDWSSISDVSEAAYDLLRRSVLSFREPVFRQADLIGLLALAVLSLNLYRPRFWCRFVCPLGALLGATARFSALRLSHAGECDRCGRCAARCPGGADPAEASAGKWRPAECYVCGNCTSTCAKGLRFSFHAPPLIGKSTPVAGLDVGRRTLLTGAVTGVIAAPLIRLPRIKQLPEPLLIRPPGALAENDFLTRCIRCGECMKVCLTAGLQPSLWEAGAEGLWTPVLIPRMGYCEYNCTLCGQVCPTGAITKLSLFAKHSLKIGTAFIDPGRCIPLTYGLDCLVCEEHCPTSPKAIEMVEVEVVAIGGARKRVRRPVIDPKRCVGCGVCEARCPVRDLPAIRVSSLGESRTPSRA
jgi:ferredoxin